jgi:putative membrane protein
VIALLLGLLTVCAYFWAVQRYGAKHPERPFSFLRIGSFAAGATCMTLVLLPPFDAAADRYFAMHMVQHVVLVLIAPPLMLLGAPLLLAVAVPPQRIARRITAAARHPIAHALLSPLTGWLLFIFVLWGAHFSPLYEASLEHPMVHVFEHLLFIVSAFLFWMPVVQVGYAPRPVAFPARILYLFLALPQGAFLGLAIYAARHVLYPHYLLHQTLQQALLDQSNGGAVMWISGGFLLFIALMITAAAWAANERMAAAA